jgi:hypothetical protein
MAGGITRGQLDPNIELGSGGGSLNFDKKGSMESLKIADDLLTGKSSLWGGTGAPTVLPTLDEVTPLNGKKSLHYINDAIAGNSSLDWSSRPVTIAEGYRDRVLEFKIQFQNTYDTAQVQFLLASETLGSNNRVTHYQENLIPFKETNNNIGTELSFRFKPNKDHDTVLWGWHILEGKAGAYIKFDDATVTPELREVQETVFIETEDSMVRLTDTGVGAAGYGSVGTAIRRFVNLEEKIGSAITYTDSATEGASFLIEEDGIYHLSHTASSDGAQVQPGISKNAIGSDLSTSFISLSQSKRLVSALEGSIGQDKNAATSVILKKGDIIRPHGTPSSSITTRNSRHQFTISKIGSVYAFPALKNQKVEIQTSEVRVDGSNSRGTAAEATTVAFQSITKLSGDAFEVNNSNGTVITVLKNGIVTVGATTLASAGITSYISLNTLNAATSPISSEILATHSQSNNAFHTSINATFLAKVGDKIRIALQTTPTSSAINRLELTHQEQEVSVTVNNIEPQYNEIDSMVRLGAASGRGSTNTLVTTWSTIHENLGSAITYNPSATLGDSFIINEDGYYDFTATYQATGGSWTKLTKNDATSIPISPADSNTLTNTFTDTSTGGETIAWSGILAKGDIVRLLASVDVSSSGKNTTLTIGKKANPSVIGIDGRPTDAYQQESDSLIKLSTGNGRGSVGVAIRRFLTIEETIGNSILYTDSATNGASFTALEDGFYSISYSDASLSPGNCGISLNATSLTTVLYYLADSEKLTSSTNSLNQNPNSSSWSGPLKKGDIIRAHADIGHDQVSNVLFSMSKVGSLTRSIPLVDSTVDIPTSEIRMEGSSTRGTGAELFTLKFDNAIKMKGEAITVDNSNGTLIKVTKAGKLSVSTSFRSTINGQFFYLTKNTINASTFPLQDQILFTDITSGTTNDIGMMWSGLVEAGDVIRVMGEVPPTSHLTNNLNILHQETEVAVALSNVKPQFEDVDSSVRVFGSPGEGSSNTFIRRFSSVDIIKGADVEYQDSVIDGASFTAKVDGVYNISYGEQSNGTGTMFFGISKNTTQGNLEANSVTDGSMIIQDQTLNGKDYAAISWSGFLSAGDVIRAHTGPARIGSSSTHRVSFTMAKQALPSIAEVDITPFAELNQQVYQATDWEAYIPTFQGFGDTSSGLNARWRRVGDTLELEVNVTGGISTGVEGQMSLPNSLVVAKTILSTSNAGTWFRDVSSNTHGGSVIMTGGDSFLNFSTNGVFGGDPTNALLPANGNAVISSGIKISINVRIPIEGWTSYNSEFKTVHAIEDNENTFNARIVNNGTASVLSENVSFIKSATRTATGLVEIIWTPGFFTEIPSVNSNAEPTISSSFYSNVDSATLLGTVIKTMNSTGSLIDSDFTLNVSRQGSDYNDLQRQIVSLADFPKVNNQITQYFEQSVNTSTFGSTKTSNAIFNNPDSNESNIIFKVTTDSINGTEFTILKEGTLNISGVAVFNSTNQGFVVLRNGVVFKNVFDNSSISVHEGICVTVAAKVGEVYSIGRVGPNPLTLESVHILGQAQELERIANVEAAENTLSARIANNGTATVTSQNIDFIQSVSRTAAGTIAVVFTPGYFSVTPSMTVSSEANTFNSYIAGESPTGVTIISTLNTTGANTDRDVTLVAHRQGLDHKNLADVVVALPESKTLYQTKFLTADVTSLGVISDLTFNNLEIGKTYELVAQMSMQSGSTSGPTLDFKNGSTIIAACQADGAGGVEASVFLAGTGAFIATDNIITAEATTATASNIIRGNGTSNVSGTRVQLRELPLYEQTFQW